MKTCENCIYKCNKMSEIPCIACFGVKGNYTEWVFNEIKYLNGEEYNKERKRRKEQSE